MNDLNPILLMTLGLSKESATMVHEEINRLTNERDEIQNKLDAEIAKKLDYAGELQKAQADLIGCEHAMMVIRNERDELTAKLATAEAKCASLCDCFDTTVCLILEDANSNLLNLQTTKTDGRVSVGLSSESTCGQKAMQGVQAGSSNQTCSVNAGLQETQGRALEKEKEEESKSVCSILSGLQKEAPGEERIGLREEESIQSALQNHTSECGCVGTDREAKGMSEMWVGRTTARPSRRLQQAIKRSMGLQNLSRETASEILNSIASDQCGKPILEKVARLRDALTRILNYPVHSEPVGGAYEMQDIAKQEL